LNALVRRRIYRKINLFFIYNFLSESCDCDFLRNETTARTRSILCFLSLYSWTKKIQWTKECTKPLSLFHFINYIFLWQMLIDLTSNLINEDNILSFQSLWPNCVFHYGQIYDKQYWLFRRLLKNEQISNKDSTLFDCHFLFYSFLSFCSDCCEWNSKSKTTSFVWWRESRGKIVNIFFYSLDIF
jgi:hypothetical protein